MSRWPWVLVAAAATLVVCGLLLAGALPLGISGEWVWGTIAPPTLWSPAWPDTVIAGMCAAAYVAWAGLGANWIAAAKPISRRVAIAVLVAAGLAVQFALQMPGYGLGKWPFVLFSPASSGYYTAAKSEVRSSAEFLARYAQVQSDYLQRNGPYHLATHPPGLVLLHHMALRCCEESPGLTSALLELEPHSVREAFRSVSQGVIVSPADEASIWLVALLSQLASGLTVLPLYVLARRSAGPAAAWSAVALWPLVPATAIFMPKSDVLYPLLATTSAAFAVGGRSTVARLCGGGAAGLVLWLGMFLSFGLATLVPMLVLAVVLQEGIRSRDGLVAAAQRIGAAAVAMGVASLVLWQTTSHNILATWLACYRNHASFYDRHPRSYWPWVGFDLAEFAVALGIPLALTALVGLSLLVSRARSQAAPGGPACIGSPWCGSGPVACAWLVTLLALDLSGKNLGEVARLWIFLMPFAVPAAAAAIERSGSRRWSGVVLLVLQLVQTLAFTASVQGFFDPASVKMP